MTLAGRKRVESLFYHSCRLTTLLALLILLVLLFNIFKSGWPWLSWGFVENFPSRFAEKAGIKAAILGSLWLLSLTAAFAVPLGVMTAVFLEEYANRNGRWVRILELNISNLAGMPSIIYGLLGLAVFVRFLGLERSILSGSLTMTLLILPVIIIASQEAIRAVPSSIRQGAYALGARKWQVVLGQVLPAALPGIMTGIILSLSRAIGEAAPLIVVGAAGFVSFSPQSPMDGYTVLPVQIFNWASRPKEEFHGLGAAGIIVLLGVLFLMNFGAIWIRQRFQRYRL